MIKLEVGEVEKRNRINETNTWLLEKTNKIDKPIASLARIKEDKSYQYQKRRRGHY